ncbi:nitric oxide dioxygenase [Vibrio navarrensis]|uniref:NO-inducible flavohemoprotein n=1 Tax=Vibrio TaxID=662 RepID=UPI0005EFC4FB|nr:MULTISPECIES: NO-inducible flavohemoprotein [Vibrio]KJR34140.1 dihydropteridine reductase [Vibrio sp. S234-5]MBE3652611.1 nitric oxide dioxygenase [Vibrio navarrensis]MBE3656371.1 nitric oxide dioxygenase [Vibrio navarrensis]MBE4604204.1 nitric oxide dioxygenase [Vibrio navarrensis]
MLSENTIQIVKSTAPLLAKTGPQLTAHFYQRMFTHHPELKEIFNMSNQRNGDQREALFNAICAYANNIDNLPALLGAVEKIAHKHSSFLISAEQYQIVGSHLLATIDELFSPGEAVLDAWAEAYGVLANVFIAREEQIYQHNEAQEGGWRGVREFELIDKHYESSTICSFVFKPTDGLNVARYKPGQYIGIHIQHPSLEHQEIRQYSLSSAPQEGVYRISVKREPSGLVSNYLHDTLQVGETVKLTAPAGDFYLDITPQTPVVLISAGVGLTPMLAMLESLSEHRAPLTWVHATENGQQHAFKQHAKALVSKLEQGQTAIWYHQPSTEDRLGDDFHFTGLVNLDEIRDKLQAEHAQVYLCGPIGFMQYAAKQLVTLGLTSERIHYECFGPHKVM